MHNIGTIKFTTHAVTVDYNDQLDTMHCFKHNDQIADWEIFPKSDYEGMCEWIITALPTSRWQFAEDPTNQKDWIRGGVILEFTVTFYVDNPVHNLLWIEWGQPVDNSAPVLLKSHAKSYPQLIHSVVSAN